MARPRKSVPTYRRHHTGRAVVSVYKADGSRSEILLPGEFDSPTSKAEYERILAQLRIGNGRLPADATTANASLTIAELVERFMDHVDRHYRRADGSDTGEKRNVIMSMRPLVRLFGGKPAAEFTPIDLHTVRDAFISGAWMNDQERAQRRKTRGHDGTTCRKETNKRIGRIKNLFKWGVEKMLVPPAVSHGLQCVVGLQAGRGNARESQDVQPVPLDDVEKTLAELPEIHADIVKVQLYSGARAGEILQMRTCDIDQDTKPGVWLFVPEKHKNAWRGHKRRIVFGPRSQLILRRYLRPEAPKAFLFKPGTVRPGGKIEHREKYSVDDYDKAIGRACKKAGVPHWSSHRLRHLASLLAERERSLEGARAYLGQKSVNMTAHYSGIDLDTAAEVAKKIG